MAGVLYGGSNIRALRMRLGWTQSDLARRLNCDSHDIELWESGSDMPQESIQNLLELLGKQAEECSEEVHQAPILENFCESKDLGQIDRSEVE